MHDKNCCFTNFDAELSISFSCAVIHQQWAHFRPLLTVVLRTTSTEEVRSNDSMEGTDAQNFLRPECKTVVFLSKNTFYRVRMAEKSRYCQAKAKKVRASRSVIYKQINTSAAAVSAAETCRKCNCVQKFISLCTGSCCVHFKSSPWIFKSSPWNNDDLAADNHQNREEYTHSAIQ